MQHTQTLYMHRTRFLQPTEQQHKPYNRRMETLPTAALTCAHESDLQHPLAAPQVMPDKATSTPDHPQLATKTETNKEVEKDAIPHRECVKEAANPEPALAKFIHLARNNSFFCEEL